MRTLLAAVLVLLVAPAAAPGLPRFEALDGDATGPPFAADASTVTWATADGARVLRVGEQTRDVPAPECARDPRAAPDVPPSYARLAGAGGGVLLWRCGDTTGWPLVQPLSAPAAQPVPGAEGPGWAGGVQSPTLRGIGARWIAFAGGLRPGWSPAFLDWRTGTMRTGTLPEGTTFDLDRPGLVRPVCAPLTAPRSGLAIRGRHAAPVTLDGDPSVGTTTLRAVEVQRCGSRAPVFRERCRSRCEDVSFGPAGLTWVDGRRLRQWRQATGSATTVADVSDPGARIVQTRAGLVTGVPVSADGPWAVTLVSTPGAGRR